MPSDNDPTGLDALEDALGGLAAKGAEEMERAAKVREEMVGEQREAWKLQARQVELLESIDARLARLCALHDVEP